MNYNNASREQLLAEIERLQNQIADWEEAMAQSRDVKQRLAESEQRYRKLVELSPDAIAVHCAKKIVFVNSAAVRMMGASCPDDLLGRHILDDIHPDNRERVQERLHRLRNNKQDVPFIEEKFRRLDGTYIDVEVAAAPVIFDNREAVQVVFREITERKKTEQQLRGSREQVKEIFDNLEVVFFSMKMPEEHLIQISEACEKLCGYSAEELIRDPSLWYEIIYHDDREKIPLAREGLTTGEVLRIQYRINHRNGDLCWVENVLKPFFDESGALSRIDGFINDITEKKAAEEDIQQYLNKLRFLSESAMELVDTFPGDEIYQFFSDRLAGMIEGSLVVISSFDESMETSTIRAISGLDDALEPIIEVLGAHPAGISFPINDEAREGLRRNEFVEIPDGLHGASFRAIPLEQARQIEDALGISTLYGMGFLKDDKLFGSAVFMLRDSTELQNKDVIETFVRQGSVALQRKRAEDKLARSETIYRKAIEATSGVPYHLRYTDYQYDFIGEGLESVLGIPSEEFQFDDFEDIVEKIIPLDPDAPADAFEYGKLFTQGKVELYRADLHIRTPGGEEKWVSDSSVPVRDERTGEVVGSLGILMDITDRKRAEKALRESEEQYRRLFEEIKDAIVLTSPEGKILSVNPAASALFGFGFYSNRNDIDIIHDIYVNPDDRERFVQQLTKNNFVKDYEVMLKRKDGERINALVTADVVRDKNGDVLYFRSIIRDITERKRLQQQLFEAQKLQSIGILVRGISHDFNNILSGILGYISILKSNAPPEQNVQKYIDAIESNTTRAAELTSRLLTFSHGTEYNIQPVEINNLVEDTLNILKRKFQENIDITTHLDADIPPVYAGLLQIQQIVMHLFTNALDAMPEGGALVITTTLSKVDEAFAKRVPDAEPGTYVVFSVEDTGIGMDEKTMSRMFEPFFTTKGVGKGTGLGLSMIYGAVQNMGGFVQVKSMPGKGSTFTLYFPVRDDTFTGKKSVLEVIRTANAGILVVDDEVTIRELLQEILEVRGYRVFCARDGSEALELFETYKDEIDLVILDIVMPGINGEDTCSRIRSLNPEVKILISSGYDKIHNLQSLLNEPTITFIEKPYQVHELLKKINSLLSPPKK